MNPRRRLAADLKFDYLSCGDGLADIKRISIFPHSLIFHLRQLCHHWHHASILLKLASRGYHRIAEWHCIFMFPDFETAAAEIGVTWR